MGQYLMIALKECFTKTTDSDDENLNITNDIIYNCNCCDNENIYYTSDVTDDEILFKGVSLN